MKELLNYYENELIALRYLLATFAKSHPQIATQLKLGPNSIGDPFVTHILEAIAFLNARIQQKLDDDIPEISNTLLDIIYPHYLQPIPSMSILQLIGQDILQGPHIIPAKTDIVTTTLKDINVRFKTCYPVALLPLEINEIKYQTLSGSSSILKIKISITNKELKISQLKFSKLRFFINIELQTAFILYELLFNQTACLELRNPDNNDTIKISDNSLSPVGFNENQNIIPNPAHSFPGYLLLSEFFTFPEKFLFFDVINLPADFMESLTEHLEILFHLRKSNSKLQQQINNNSFALNCTPIINLFEQNGVPIHFVDKQQSYHIKADNHFDLNAMEIHSIVEVNASTDNEAYPCYPMYGVKYNQQQTNHEAIYWHITRKPTWEISHNNIPGHELFVNIIDPNETLNDQSNIVIHTKIRCCNRNLTEDVSYSDDINSFQFWHHADEYVVGMIRLSRITSPSRSKTKKSLTWKLIRHLSTNYLLFDNDTGLKKLQDILNLYNFNDNTNLLTGLVQLKTQQKFIRHPHDSRNGFCKTTEITLIIDETKSITSHWYLLASVLFSFFNMSSTINSFTTLILASKQHGVLAQWQLKV